MTRASLRGGDNARAASRRRIIWVKTASGLGAQADKPRPEWKINSAALERRPDNAAHFSRGEIAPAIDRPGGGFGAGGVAKWLAAGDWLVDDSLPGSL